jgi:hypothetical protein
MEPVGSLSRRVAPRVLVADQTLGARVREWQSDLERGGPRPDIDGGDEDGRDRRVLTGGKPRK